MDGNYNSAGFLENQTKSIRAFIGAKDFKTSRAFYSDLGFKEVQVAPNMCYFSAAAYGFYLQDSYVKRWINNSMIFLEVTDMEATYNWLNSLGLESKYKGVKLSKIVVNDWGSECFLHDPSGVLWHFGIFNK